MGPTNVRRINVGVAFCVCVFALSFSSCNRSGKQVWEDSKTASRYVGKGVKSLFGKYDASEELSRDEFKGPPDLDYVPLNEQDAYAKSGDMSALDENSNLPQPKESPGDGTIPGIDSFIDPSAAGLTAFFSRIQFEYDQATIRPEYEAGLKKAAQYLKEHPNMYVFVEGHCDERGSASYNLALGSRRSNSVRNVLVREGADLNNIFTISYGKERPINLEHSETGWGINRRADFKVLVR